MHCYDKGKTHWSDGNENAKQSNHAFIWPFVWPLASMTNDMSSNKPSADEACMNITLAYWMGYWMHSLVVCHWTQVMRESLPI